MKKYYVSEDTGELVDNVWQVIQTMVFNAIHFHVACIKWKKIYI